MLGALRVMPKVAASTPPVAGYVAWYDASDTSSITSSGGAVSQWNDKSNNNYHVVQSVAGKKPITGATTRNGLNVLDFSRANATALKYATGFDLSGVLSVFAVVNSSSGTAYSQGICNQDPGSGTRVFQFKYNSSTQLNCIVFSFVQATSTITADAWHVASAVSSASSTQSFVDGTGGTATGARTPVSGTVAFEIGYSGGGGADYLTGSIGEIILYASALSSGNRQSVESYLKTKWGTP